jgi:small-conductance mechanosensitive channel
VVLSAVEPLKILRDELEGLLSGLVALLPNILAALLVVLVTWGVARLLARGAGRVLRRSHLRISLQRALVSLTRISVWTAGLMIAAIMLFPNLTPTKLLAGLGIGSIAVGLAFKNIFENFLAGMLILLRKPMQIGDDIVCEGVAGRVEEISLRDTYIRERSGELVLVPNSFLYKSPIKVLTDRRTRRIELMVGVGYDTDLARAHAVIGRAFEGLSTPDRDRRPDILVTAFGESSIDFLIRWWAGSTPIEEHRSRDEVAVAVKRALDAAGIEIPSPRRVLEFADPLPIARPPAEPERRAGKA